MFIYGAKNILLRNTQIVLNIMLTVNQSMQLVNNLIQTATKCLKKSSHSYIKPQISAQILYSVMKTPT